MKAISMTRMITGIIILVILIITSYQAHSQQVITFTNGSVLKVFITYQTKDTIKYYKDGNQDVIYSETMDHVVKIVAAEPLNKYTPGPKIAPLPEEKEYWKYKKGVTTGAILMGTGALLTLAGGLGWSATNDASDANETLGAVFSVMGMVFGTGLFVTGGIVTIVNSSNLSIYKKQHPEVSLRLKSTPQVTGLSLVCRF